MPINSDDASMATFSRDIPAKRFWHVFLDPHLTHLVRRFPDAHHDGL